MASLVTQAWLDSSSAIRGILVEVTVNIDGSDTVLYLSNIGYKTTTADTIYQPIIVGRVQFTETISLDGSVSLSFGDLQIANYNGEYDSWLDSDHYVWVNRPIKIYLGDPLWVCANISEVRTNFECIFTGLVADIDSKAREFLNIKVRNALENLNTSVTEDTLANVVPLPPTTVNHDTLAPLVFGEVFNISPILVDPGLLKYMVHNGPIEEIIEVRDNGSPIYNSSMTVPSFTVTSTHLSVAASCTATAVSALTSFVTVTNTANLFYGNSITFTTGAGTLITGLVSGTPYYISSVQHGKNTITLSDLPLSNTAWVNKTFAADAVGSMSVSSSISNVMKLSTATTSAFLPNKMVKFNATRGSVLLNTVYYINKIYDSEYFSVCTDPSSSTNIAVSDSAVTMVVTVPPLVVDLTTGTFKLNYALKGACTISVRGAQKTVSTTGTPIPTYTDNIAKIIGVITTQYGKDTKILAADLDTSTFSGDTGTFANVNQQPVGIYITSKENVLTVCQNLAASIGAHLFMNRLGKLQLLRIGVPTSDTSFTITDSHILHHSLDISNRTPVIGTTKIAYCKDWTVQTNLLSAIPIQHKSIFATEYIPATVKDTLPGTTTKYKLTTEPEPKTTYLLVDADAVAEATRLNTFYGTPKTVYRFTGTSSLLMLKLGQPVVLKHNRFGLSAGKTGQVISLTPKWINSTIEIEVII